MTPSRRTFLGGGTAVLLTTVLPIKLKAADVPIRRVVEQLKLEINNILERSLFEYNDHVLRAGITAHIENFLKKVPKKQLADYQVVCDGINNTPNIIDAHELVLDVDLKTPNETWIKLNSRVSPNEIWTME